MRAFFLSALAACLAIFVTGCGEPDLSTPWTIAEVIRVASRSSESGVPARIRGVVSFVDPKAGDVVVEDPTGGVRLALGHNRAPAAGDLVEVAGFLEVTGESGVMLEPSIQVLGTANRPRPIQVSLKNLDRDTNRTVQLRGVVESFETERAGIGSLLLRADGLRAIASVHLDVADADQLLDAEIELTGVVARGTSSVREPLIWSRIPTDVRVIKSAPARNLIPMTSVDQVVKTTPAAAPGHRVRVRGQLVAATSGSLFLKSGTGRIQIDYNPNSDATASDADADLIGFLNYKDGIPGLEAAEPFSRERESSHVIRSAKDVHLLPIHTAALHQLVRLKAVVTYSDPPVLFVQDATDAVFVFSRASDLALKAGSLVEVRGVTLPGQFAPSIGSPVIQVVGRSPLPAPIRDTESVFTGRQDCRWVEFEGVVQKVDARASDTLLSLVWGTHSFKAHVPRAAGSMDALLDRYVTIRGAVGTLYNDRRQFLGVQLFVPGSEFITVKDSGAAAIPITKRPIKSLLEFSAKGEPGHQLHVEGIVTLSNPNGPTWIRDRTGGLQILSHQNIVLAPGDVVDVFGYVQVKSFGPAMRDAQITKVQSGKNPDPVRISVDEAMRGKYESQLVEIEGTIVSSSLQSANRSLTLRSNPYVFEARFASFENPIASATVEPGARVLLRGIVSATVEQRQDTIEVSGFQIMLRSPGDLVVLKPAPWLTASRIGFICGAALLVLLGSVCWISLLRRSVSSQTRTLMERTSELQAANRMANDALNRAREAEGVELDRRAILELVAKDESLPCIMRAICEAAAKHLKLAGCSIQLHLADGSRISEASGFSQGISAIVSSADIDSISESRTLQPIRNLCGDHNWEALAPALGEDRLDYYCAAPIRRGRTAGFLIGFARKLTPDEFHSAGMESWSSIASLAMERRGFFEQLSYRAQHDDLTGLVNRASLYERVELEISKAAQAASGLSLIYLDLDGFKKVNDTHGHDAGDAVLREVSRRLSGSIRRTDIAGRVGGDEFVVLLPGVSNREEAIQIGRLITDALRLPVSFGETKLETGSSLGVAIYPEDGTQTEALMKSADEDMYRQKARRKVPAREPAVWV